MTFEPVKAAGKGVLPAPFWRWLSLAYWQGPRILTNPQNLLACTAFIADPSVALPLKHRLRIVRQLYGITLSVPSPHTDTEMIRYIKTILCLPPGSSGLVAEAGCYKGIGTAKFSLAAAAVGKELVVFDSFQGIPANDEPHYKTIFGGPAQFAQGDYAWGLEGVKANIARYGHLQCCRFIEGWFDDTLPSFNEPLAAIYLDVDLAASTRTCIKYLYPLLEPGGVMFSQDGHLPLVIDVLNDDHFWEQEVGCAKPPISGLGKKKLVKIVKPPAG